MKNAGLKILPMPSMGRGTASQRLVVEGPGPASANSAVLQQEIPVTLPDMAVMSLYKPAGLASKATPFNRIPPGNSMTFVTFAKLWNPSR